jgi:spore germination protein YaaH
MKSIGNAVNEYGMMIDLDKETGQKYARAEKNGVVYEMWIEDYASIENKLIAVQERDLAGIAAWRLGYEEQEIWELIGSYIQ